jgi:phosphoglycerol transferase MdoB-like AlkP superfamily enzyme
LVEGPGTARPPNVLLVLVESWGDPRDSLLARAVSAAYDDPGVADKYVVSRGLVAFQGSTIPAEARELCQSKMGFSILNAPRESLRGCLPDWFRARDYQSLSVHGNIGSMFQRSAWYPRIGFERSWFGPELEALKLPMCDGAFRGTCDAAVAEWIGSSLLSEETGKPRFVYWVTLNSHLPVPVRPNLPDGGACSALPELRDSASLCSWFRLVRNVHQSIERLALAPSARPTVFVVVGDHAPPFADPGLRQEFSAAYVPYVVLRPRPESPRSRVP